MKPISFFALALACLPTALSAADSPSQPNVVFFLVDDLGYTDCGFNGGKQIKTPHIDRLAGGGAVLAAHYVQPVCSPTRAALMTGRYATRTGVYTIVRPHAQWGLPLEERTLANALHDAGYETAITGKWHLGEFERTYLPTSRGFDHQYGHYFGAIDYFTHVRDRTHDWHRDDRELKEDGYSTELVAREACRLIAAKDPAKPLFLYVPFNGVHSPLQVPERYLEPYGNLEGPRRKLAGMLSAVDEAVGRIVAALEQAGLRENTLIVFSSDNGGPKPGDNSPLRDFKGSLYEGGVRGCAFANWPGKIPAGRRIQHPIHVIDWYPTIVKLAGGGLEQKTVLDGKDVWPMLTTDAPSPHDAILCVKSPTEAAIRVGDWKLIRRTESPADRAKKKARPKAESIELYDLAADLGETKNLAAQEPDRVMSMSAALSDLLKNAVAARAAAGDDSE